MLSPSINKVFTYLLTYLPCLKFSSNSKHTYFFFGLTEKYFFYFSTKTYVVGTQKNHLHKTVLSSTQNISLKSWVSKYLQLYAESFSLSKPMCIIVLIWSNRIGQNDNVTRDFPTFLKLGPGAC